VEVPTPRRRPTPGRLALALGLALAAVLALRLVAMDQQSFWGTAEQHYYGLFPHHLVQGLAGAPADYLPEAHQGCGLLWGAACAPVFAAVGPTRGALRWCNLGWHLAMFAVFALLAVRLAGLPGLALTGLLWALAPPALVTASHFGWVSHIDAGLLTGAGLLCLARAADGAHPRSWTFAAGLLAGLALWFHLSSLLVVAALAVAALVTVRPIRALWPALVGALLGALPLLRAALGWHALPGGLDQAGGQSLVARTWGLLAHDLPGMLGFAGTLAGLGCLGLLLALPAGARWRERDRLIGLGAGLAIGVHLVGSLLSGADLGPGRHLLPMWPWMALAAAAIGPDLVRRDARARGGLVGLLLLLGLCALPLRSPPHDPAPRAWADSRAAWILPEHPFGNFVLPDRYPEEVLEIAERTPLDRPSLLLIAGRAAGRAARPGAFPACPEPDAAAWPWWTEGVASERAGREGPFPATDGPERRAWHAGRLLALHRARLEGDAGHWTEADEGLTPDERDALCAAFGTWSAPLEWTTEPLHQDSWCRPELFAVGFGAGVARAWLPAGRTPDGAPQLAWWIGEEDATAALQAAFACGFEAEAARVNAAVSRVQEAPPWPTDACAAHVGSRL
jgi:hypothetical protein